MHPITASTARFLGRLALFGWTQVRACLFAAALFCGMALSTVLPDLPVARYDLLLGYGILLTAAFLVLRWETRREAAVIAVCHLLGLAFELVKVRVGSWSYPEPALTKVAGVPLYGGFMYAAVGSYVCRAWRLFGLRVTGYRVRATALVAAALYANFLTHHWLPDLRWVLALLLLAATAGTAVHYRVGERRCRMPLALAFTLIGFFLWVAENIATYFGAWSYPSQLGAWEPVPLSKWASWALLISVTFALVHALVARNAARPSDADPRAGRTPGPGRGDAGATPDPGADPGGAAPAPAEPVAEPIGTEPVAGPTTAEPVPAPLAPAPRPAGPLLCLAPALLLTLLLTLPGFVPNTGPRAGSLLDTFLPWLGLGVPVLAALALWRRAPDALCAALVPAAAWAALYGAQLVPRADAPYDLTAVQHNASDENPDPAATARRILDAEPSLVALQELTPATSPGFAAALGPALPHHAATGTVGLWSRFPLTDVRPVPIRPRGIGEGWDRCLRATARTPHGDVAVYVAHLPSLRLSPSGGFGSARRDESAALLGAALAAEPLDRVVLLGDLNGTLDDRGLAPVTSRLDPPAPAFAFSWPAAFPVARIDQVLTRRATVTGLRPLDATPSDHLPLAARIRLHPGPPGG